MCHMTWPLCFIFCWLNISMGDEHKRKTWCWFFGQKMWMVLYSTPFIYCWWLEWVNCWYLLGFTNFLHCRSIFYRSNFEGTSKVRCLYDTEKWILVSQHNFMTWSCYAKPRNLKSYILKWESDFWKIISQTRDLWRTPRVQLLLLHVYGQEYGWYHPEQDWQYLFGILIIIVIVVIVVIPFVIGYQFHNVSR